MAKVKTTKKVIKAKSKSKPASKVDPVDPFDIELQKMKDDLMAMTSEELHEEQSTRRVYSTGWLGLDLAIAKIDKLKRRAGAPARTVFEIIGKNGSGKTALMLQRVKCILDDDPENIVLCLFAEEPDAEMLMSMNFDKRFMFVGCYKAKDYNEQFLIAENMIDRMCKAARNPKVKALIIDSVRALVAYGHVYQTGRGKKGKDRPFDATETALRAQLLEKLFNRLRIYRTEAELILINQVSQKIGEENYTYDYFLETCGGRKKEHEAYLRLELSSMPKHDKEVQRHELFDRYKPGRGLYVSGWLFKNKYCQLQGGRRVSGDYDFKQGRFLNEKYAASYAAYVGLLEKNGQFYKFKEGSAQGEDQAQAYLEAHPEEYQELCEALADKEVINRLFDFKPGQAVPRLKVEASVKSKKKYDDDEPEPEDDMQAGDELSRKELQDDDEEEAEPERKTPVKPGKRTIGDLSRRGERNHKVSKVRAKT